MKTLNVDLGERSYPIFIGSGLFDMKGLARAGQKIGLATDIGGGSSFSMLKVMATAYEIAQLRGHALHPADLLWLSTRGSAESIHLDKKIGNLAPGMEADILVLDLYSTTAISQRANSLRIFGNSYFLQL